MRTITGTITAAKMTDTVTVTVHRSVFHPLYRKRYRVSKKFLADTKGVTDLGLGDTVEITECRPLSKRKCFRITQVLKRAPRVSDIQEESTVTETIQESQRSKKSQKNPSLRSPDGEQLGAGSEDNSPKRS